MDHLKLTVDKLSIDAVSDLVVNDSCGAVTVFVGTTRDNFEGKKVVHLEYEAYEAMALKVMKTICDEVREKWPNVHGIAIYHRLGNVPCREASVVIAVSSPHRQDSLAAVPYCIDRLKASVPVWKKEVYDGEAPAWKENVEWPSTSPHSPMTPRISPEPTDKSLVQINVSSDELNKRIENFIERKREQVNINNVHDFIPSKRDDEPDDAETCARVRTQFVRRKDSKGHLKIRKVYNEWGPQTVHQPKSDVNPSTQLPSSIAERVQAIESYLNTRPVSPDIYKRLKQMEDKIAYLETISPEYAQFWKREKEHTEVKPETMDYIYSSEDIERKIEQLEKQYAN